MFRFVVFMLAIILTTPVIVEAKYTPVTKEAMVRLPGHVLSALAKAEPVKSEVSKDNDPMTLTLVLKRDDQEGFDRYLHDVYDPKSKIYRKFLSKKEVVAQFGPSQNAYNLVLQYLKDNKFELIEGSSNRLVLTVKGRLNDVERAFSLQINGYQINERRFFANEGDPSLPKKIVTKVESILGLSNLAQLHHVKDAIEKSGIIETLNCVSCYASQTAEITSKAQFNISSCVSSKKLKLPYNAGSFSCVDPPNPGDWRFEEGGGQTIGILSFDTFHVSDVVDYLSLIGAPSTLSNNLSQVHINGGASLGVAESEVLLDVDTTLLLAPGAKVVVYDAPFIGPGSFQALFNAMINGGVTVISNSWAYCEDQTTAADVLSIDAILKNAAAVGISVFNASGDTGSTCLDGTPNTVSVPADSPNATAVGGVTLITRPGPAYGSEKWWDGTSNTPSTGQGGFGVSRFFTKPSYQIGLSSSNNRSIPDVVVNADPEAGIILCQADAGGCPNGMLYGGTSASAPAWAAFAAILNHAVGHNLGALNPIVYPLANTSAFNTPVSMGSDFAHVGLGSPNLNVMKLMLAGQVTGTPDAEQSEVFQARSNLQGPVSADGTSQGSVVVKLRDGLGNTVGGKNILLSASDNGGVTIVPLGGVITDNTGTAIFSVMSNSPKTITFTVTDATDGIILNQKPNVIFAVPPATSASLNAFPTTVNANGTSTTTLTITLKDALNRPTPGKLITLSQGGGHSVITGPKPNVTDSNGQIQFTATNLVNETVTYSAIDSTDGDLPIPGNPQVTFSGGSGLACGQTAPPIGANGYLITPYISGFDAGPFFYGNVNWNGCPGGTLPAFGVDAVFTTSFKTGGVYKLGLNGGVAASSNQLSTAAPTLELTYGKDGRLYGAYGTGAAGFFAGSIVELDPTSGSVLRTVAPGVTCATLAVDPLSGDLFFDDQCSGGGSDNPNIFRIKNPGSNTPTVETYVTLPATPNARMAFAPNGSLYVVSYSTFPAPVYRVSGTNTSPPVITKTSATTDYSLAIGETLANGEAKSLIVHAGNDIKLVDITTNPATETILGQGSVTAGVSGPDGCLYMTSGDTLYKLSNSGGGCTFAPTSPNPSLSLALAAGSPAPVQGGSQTLKAALHKVPTPAGSAVFFTVTGANAQIKLVRADANGNADLSYTATFAGKDTILASSTLNGVTLSSNPVTLNWAGGKHVTFLSLNLSPGGGTQQGQTTVVASLTDVSAQPPVVLANQAVNFTLGGRSCSAVTDSKGLATCSMLLDLAGMETLAAHFAENSQFVKSDASIGFNVMPPVALPPPQPTLIFSLSPTTVLTGVNATLTWSSTNATSCAASDTWSGSKLTGGSQNVSQALSGSYVYSLTCDGAGGSVKKSVTLTVEKAPSIACDIDSDGDVDRNDISLITVARNQVVLTGDPRDFDKDGKITVNDARACTLRCTRSLCAIN